MEFTLIAGARPNFMKIAPIIHELNKVMPESGINYRLVHTGQHYDEKMSESFFRELNIPEPHINLGCGGGTQAEQTAAIMMAFEKELTAHPTDLVMVVGDVTSTMACSIVARKMNTKVAHVEAGIRSFDLSMPEEINRMVTDCLTDYFFTTTPWAGENLRKAGIPDERIFWVGNVMIDTLLANLPRLRKPMLWDKHQLKQEQYFVMTLHRPANVDEEETFTALLDAIIQSVQGLPIIFPVHPRARQTLKRLDITRAANLILCDPMGYLEFNYLVRHAKAVITDSGGITEETTVMGIPCLTLRNNTERPETVETGTNELIGTNPDAIKPAIDRLFSGQWKKGSIPEKWDGRAAERIIKKITEIFRPSEFLLPISC
jgi:UDP-N-acetylglucosamine 2-epimerase (non-hydrolysing)